MYVHTEVMQGPRDQNVMTPGDLVLTCVTNPIDLPVEWIYWRNLNSPEKLLSEDPRAIIQPSINGSMLTFKNSTMEDSGFYICRFNIDLSPTIEPILASEAIFDVLIIPGTFIHVSKSTVQVM